jgi:hypothetical protein
LKIVYMHLINKLRTKYVNNYGKTSIN